MIAKDCKQLLLKHSSALFALHYALKSLAYSEVAPPILRYNRGVYSDYELYWCNNNIPAPLELVWSNHTYSHTLRLTGCITSQLSSPPKDIRLKALELLKELDNQRELVAIYRCGYIKDDVFILSGWLSPYSADCEAGSGTYLTVTCEGVLGLAYPYDS